MNLGHLNQSTLSIVYIIALFVILWFLMIRPQQQRQKKHQEMVRDLGVNDNVITAGGIYGTIVKVKEDSFVIKVADNVRIEVLRNAVSQRRDSEDEVNNKE